MIDLKLSIVFPCYNEGKKIQNAVDSIINYLNKFDLKSYEIIIVNDGSKDNSINYIIDIKEQYPNIIKLVHYKNNKGKGYAVKKGLLEATGDYAIFMDTDLSTDLSAIDNCIKIIKEEKTPIIIGSRRLPESELAVPQTGIRKITGIGCKIYTNMKLKLKLKDTQCGFKCFKTNIVKKIIEKQTIDGWAFDAELLYIARLNNIEIKEIPVKWENDEDSKVSPFQASIKFISDLGKIKKNKDKYIFN